jgi:hypothetical protein
MKTKQLSSNVVVISVILIVCAYYAGKRAGHHRQAYIDALLAHQAANQACCDLGEEVWNRMTIVCHNKSITIAEFESLFGAVVKIDESEGYTGSDTAATHYYTHPKSNRTFDLHFRDGVLMSFGCSQSPYDENPNLPSIEERMAQML